jgi:choline-sulfatase
VAVWNNDRELPSADIPSLPHVLNQAGYESLLCGKQHYDFSRRYGFTEIGGNFNNNYKTGKGKRLAPDDLEQRELSSRFEEFYAGDHGNSVEHDRHVTAGAIEFLAPHFPLTVPEEYWDRYRGKIEMPIIPEDYLDSLPFNYKHLRTSFGLIGAPDETVRRGRELYCGLTNWVDSEIGKVLETLRSNKKIAENTVITYASDHGENMAEHGLWWKNSMHEDPAHVPLIISWPQRSASDQRRAGGILACRLSEDDRGYCGRARTRRLEWHLHVAVIE